MKAPTFLLSLSAKALRLVSTLVLNWPAVLALICVISPISLHIKLPQELVYAPCQYLGARGIIDARQDDCPLIAVIDTRSAAMHRFELPFTDQPEEAR